MSSIDSTDRIRSDIDGLLEDRRNLRDLRQTLDGYRRIVETPSGVELVRHETDYEVIARLAGQTHRGLAGCLFQDETGRALGTYAGIGNGVPFLDTNNAYGRAYADGRSAGVQSAAAEMEEIRAKTPPVGTHVVDADGRPLGVLQRLSHGKVVVAVSGHGRCTVAGGQPPEPIHSTIRDDIKAWGNRPGAPRATPKPIRLHAGQTWRHPDGGETCLTYLGPSRGVDQYGFGGFTMDIGPDWTVIDARGNVLIAGPGFTG